METQPLQRGERMAGTSRRRVASNEEICVWRIDLSHAAARLQRLRLRQELAGARSVLKILECR